MQNARVFRRRTRRALRVEVLERRLCQSVFYDLEPVAQTGTGPLNLLTIGTGVSINDHGYVAFQGSALNSDSAPADNVYAWNPANSTASSLMNDVFMYPNAGADQLTAGTQSIFTDVQINNQNDVLARRRMNAAVQVGFPFGQILTAPLTYLETWNADATNPPGLPSSLPAMGLPAGASAPLWFFLNPATGGVVPSPLVYGSSYEAIFNPSTINNNGQVNFTALIGGANNRISSNTSGDLVGRGGIGNLSLTPMLGDNGFYVMTSNDGRIFAERWDYSLPFQLVAGPTSGFTSVGEAAISDSGKVIAFAGSSSTLGAGIFVSKLNAAGTAFETPVRVAGLPHELGYDETGNGLQLNAFDLSNRVSVTHQEFGAAGFEDDTIVVAFIATPNAASRSNPRVTTKPLLFSGQEGLWTVRIDCEADLDSFPFPAAIELHPSSPVPVVQVGDKVDGLTIQQIALHDGLAVPDLPGRTARRADHWISFWAQTSAGQVVFRGEKFDSDEDGLYDHWERAGGGIDIDQDGTTDLNLAAMGADPFSRDLFLEVDWLSDRTSGGSQPWKNEPPPGTVQDLVNMFANAPALANGIPAGIRLHVDAGPRRDAAGNPFSINMGTGSLQGGDRITQEGTGQHIDVVYFGLDGSLSVPGLVTRSFQNIKDNFFGTRDKRARELAFRYTVLADFYELLSEAGQTVSPSPLAVTQALTAQDRLRSLGAFVDNKGNTLALGGSVVKITSGTGAGQVRMIRSNTVDELTVRTAWATRPDTTSTFVLLSGSSGLSEADWYASPNNQSVAGNDFIVSLGEWGVNQGILGTEFEVWRTMAHEMGHTLGLRHGGTDHNACKGNAYVSLMSYSHQLATSNVVVCGGQVQALATIASSYSDSSDPTYDDWSNLKLGFQERFVHLGNTFGKGLGAANPVVEAPSLNLAEAESINQGPFDIEPPVVQILAPALDASYQAGDSLTVRVSATDPSGMGTVWIYVDLNADGDTDDLDERQPATVQPNGEYQAVLSPVSGAPGRRTPLVFATDAWGNFTLAPTWHNTLNFLDVDADTFVTSLDALIVINYLNSTGPGAVPADQGIDRFYYDVTSDANVDSLDALRVINYLNSLPVGGEGESAIISDEAMADLSSDHTTDGGSSASEAAIDECLALILDTSADVTNRRRRGDWQVRVNAPSASASATATASRGRVS